MFSKGSIPFCSIPSVTFKASIYLQQYFFITSFFKIIAILMYVKWNLIMVLICTYLMTNGIDHLFMYCYLFVYLLWWNVHSNLLPNLLLDCVSYTDSPQLTMVRLNNFLTLPYCKNGVHSVKIMHWILIFFW